MSPAAQKVITLTAGLAAVVFLVYADVAGLVLGAASAGFIGAIAGAGVGMLVPAPGHSERVVEALREGAKAIAASQEPRAAESTEQLR